MEEEKKTESPKIQGRLTLKDRFKKALKLLLKIGVVAFAIWGVVCSAILLGVSSSSQGTSAITPSYTDSISWSGYMDMPVSDGGSSVYQEIDIVGRDGFISFFGFNADGSADRSPFSAIGDFSGDWIQVQYYANNLSGDSASPDFLLMVAGTKNYLGNWYISFTPFVSQYFATTYIYDSYRVDLTISSISTRDYGNVMNNSRYVYWGYLPLGDSADNYYYDNIGLATSGSFTNVIASAGSTSAGYYPAGRSMMVGVDDALEVGDNYLPIAYSMAIEYGSPASWDYDQGYSDGYGSGYNDGFGQGYDSGYADGVNTADDSSTDSAFYLIANAFNAVGGVLNIQFLPGISLATIVAIPIVGALVFWLIKLIAGG